MLYDKRWETPVETKPLEPWRQVLLDAADYIEVHGWCQGHYQLRGAVCALGAVRAIVGPKGLVTGDGGEAISRLGNVLGTISYWNDAPGRTKAEVIAKLREAARK